MKDHEIAALVNKLTQVAREYHHTQQLRERIAQLVRPAIELSFEAGYDRALQVSADHKSAQP